MNTIVAFSDSHNYPLPDRLVEVANESKFVFFLGDGISALGDLLCQLLRRFGVDGDVDAALVLDLFFKIILQILSVFTKHIIQE